MRRTVKKSCCRRLRQLERRVCQLSEALAGGHSRVELVARIAEMRAELGHLAEEVLRESVALCAQRAIRSDNAANRQRDIAELVVVVSWASR